MQEHQFPFDVSADLRREVKLEVERAKIEQEAKAVSARGVAFLQRTGLLFCTGIIVLAVLKAFDSGLPSWKALVAITLVPVGMNYRLLAEITSRWRELKQARKRLKSWNAVAADYNNIIRRERETNASL